MLVGLTFDLRSAYLAEGYSEEQTAEFDREETIEAIETAILGAGHRVDRIGHIRLLVERLAAGDRWDVVFNICEGLAGIAREAQVPAVLDAYGIPYTFSDPMLMSLCLHKGMTKRVLRGHGVQLTPEWVVDSIDSLSDLDIQFPAFVKPVAEGTGKGIHSDSKVLSYAELHERCKNLLDEFHQPVIIEPFLGGREFTVGIVGTGNSSRVLGTLEIVLLDDAEPEVYSYENKERCEELVDYRLVSNNDPEVEAAENNALQAWRILGCRDAGRIDLRSDSQGHPHFLEVNPLAGLHPSHSDLPMLCTAIGMEYDHLIRLILDSAASRRSILSPSGSHRESTETVLVKS